MIISTMGEKVRVPIIKVKDRWSGRTHIVGTNCHDWLHIVNGHIDYYNLQNGDGTEFIDKGLPANEGYEFCGTYDDYRGEAYIEFVELDDFITIMKKEQANIDEINEALLKIIEENGGLEEKK